MVKTLSRRGYCGQNVVGGIKRKSLATDSSAKLSNGSLMTVTKVN